MNSFLSCVLHFEPLSLDDPRVLEGADRIDHHVDVVLLAGRCGHILLLVVVEHHSGGRVESIVGLAAYLPVHHQLVVSGQVHSLFLGQ